MVWFHNAFIFIQKKRVFTNHVRCYKQSSLKAVHGRKFCAEQKQVVQKAVSTFGREKYKWCDKLKNEKSYSDA